MFTNIVKILMIRYKNSIELIFKYTLKIIEKIKSAKQLVEQT